MSKPPTFTSAAEVEAAFYDAIIKADLEAMMAVWSEEEEVICIHPGGPRLVGLTAVRELWRQIFENGPRISVRTSHQVIIANTMLVMHNVLEHFSNLNETTHAPPVVATNIYTRTPHGWRMVVHHASPTPDISQLELRGVPHILH